MRYVRKKLVILCIIVFEIIILIITKCGNYWYGNTIRFAKIPFSVMFEANPEIFARLQENNIYVNNILFLLLQIAYMKFPFESSYEQGTLMKYNSYKEQFYKFLQGEKAVIDKNNDKEYYIEEIVYNMEGMSECNLNLFTYYFFDINGDNLPELCIRDKSSHIILEYNEQNDIIYIWNDFTRTYIEIYGTKKFYNIGGEGLMQYGINGELECSVHFKVEAHGNIQTGKEELWYFVSYPEYKTKNEKVIGRLKAQFTNQDSYWFRVTEKQYYSLTNKYFETLKVSEKEKNKVTYTYEDLFLKNF